MSYLHQVSTEERKSVSEYMFCELTLVVDDQEVTTTILRSKIQAHCSIAMLGRMFWKNTQNSLD